jgi:hypothetical protein
MPDLPWFDYSGQRLDDLLSLEDRYRIDSLVVAVEQAIQQKLERAGPASLTNEERVVLAIEALEREVNNGGYEQFFLNSSREFASIIAQSLKRIGCRRTATITERALDALGCAELTPDAIEQAIVEEDEDRDQALFVCDNQYFARDDDIEGHLWAFIKDNSSKIQV